MKIVLERSGGFAAVPALSCDIAVDTAELPPELASELDRLVTAAQLEQRPPAVPAPPGAADMRTYRLIVDNERWISVVEFTDIISDPALHALVTRLEEIGRGQ